MFISRIERSILKTIYTYWNDKNSLAAKLNKKRSAYQDISAHDIDERFGRNGFTAGELYFLCMALRIYKNYSKEKKEKRQETSFDYAINRLFADNYIETIGNQINVTNKGIMVATDRWWIGTILRENETWLLAVIISIIALIISILGLLIK